MDKFDEKVIGYESTKNILRQILDALKRPELYKSKGASIPRGLLMESDPGLGKSLLATVFIKESGRKSYVFRKTSQENSFLDELRVAFLAAKEAAPSILLLEDLNLYVESNSPYAPEWACLQACIDDARNTDIFVIATTNDTKYMPPSLLRPGRFDYTLYLDPPTGKTAEKIVSYYLRDKDLAEDVLISDIVKAMPKVSCATLETVMNLAALNSTYQGHEHIYKDDVTDALLQVVYKISKTDKSLDLTECQKIALHEAAHAVVGEILNPDSIGIVTIRGNQSCIGGFENGCSTYLKNEEELLNDITKTLAGKAGVSLIYGVMDVNKNRTQFMFGGEPQKISFNYYGPSVEAVLDKFPMAKVVDEKEGVCSIEAEVFGTGVKMWLLSQGSKVKVTAPETLVQEMKQEIERMNNQY